MSDKPYLEPNHLRILRKVWQGRVTVELAARGRLRFTADSKPMTVTEECILAALIHEGYVGHRLTVGEEWALVRTTDLGDQTLIDIGADTNILHDMTAAEARALVAG